MKALSLTQPWATLVSTGAKCIETRSWPTSFRGPLAIHASKRFPVECRELCAEWPFDEALARVTRDPCNGWYELPRGAIVATCRLVACRMIVRRDQMAWPTTSCDRAIARPDEPEASFGDYTPGRYAWLLDDVQALSEPIPCRGALQLWDVPDDARGRIAAQMGATAWL